MQGAQDGSCTVPFNDLVVAGELSAILDQAVDAGVVEGTDHDVHWLRHQCVCEGAEFPVAEVGGGEEDASAGLFGLEKMFKSFVTYPLVNVLAIEARESREDPDEARYGDENFIG